MLFQLKKLHKATMKDPRWVCCIGDNLGNVYVPDIFYVIADITFSCFPDIYWFTSASQSDHYIRYVCVCLCLSVCLSRA